jgi:hypothetical protein
MNPNLKGFFDTAKASADAVTAEQAAIEDAAAQKQARIDANKRYLDGLVREELSPIIEALKSLPPKDGKSFRITTEDTLWDERPSHTIYIAYAEPDADFSRYDRPRGLDKAHPRVSLNVQLNYELKPNFHCTQYSLLVKPERVGMSPYFKHTQPESFDELRQGLAFGLGRFAADRMEELAAAMEGISVPAQAIPVFPKPLNLEKQAATKRCGKRHTR